MIKKLDEFPETKLLFDSILIFVHGIPVRFLVPYGLNLSVLCFSLMNN